MNRTEITEYSHNGGICFHSIEPRYMTEREIEQEIDNWLCDRNNHIVVKRTLNGVETTYGLYPN